MGVKDLEFYRPKYGESILVRILPVMKAKELLGMTDAELRGIARGNRYTDPNYPIGQDISPESLFAEACRRMGLDYRKTSYVILASRFLGSKVDLSQDEIQKRIGKEDWQDYIIDWLWKREPRNEDSLYNYEDLLMKKQDKIPPEDNSSVMEDRVATGKRRLVL